MPFLPGATKSPPGLEKPSFSFFYLSALFEFQSFFHSLSIFLCLLYNFSTFPFRFFNCFFGFEFELEFRLPHSRSFQSGQNQLPPFQAIPVRPKPTSSIPSHSSQAKTNFRHSMLFQSGQNQLSQFQAIPVRAILSITPLFSPCVVAAGHQTIQLLFLPERFHDFSKSAFLGHWWTALLSAEGKSVDIAFYG
jgi:hypothetical protein